MGPFLTRPSTELAIIGQVPSQTRSGFFCKQTKLHCCTTTWITIDRLAILNLWYFFTLTLLLEVPSHSFKTFPVQEFGVFSWNFRRNWARRPINLSNCRKLVYDSDALNTFFMEPNDQSLRLCREVVSFMPKNPQTTRLASLTFNPFRKIRNCSKCVFMLSFVDNKVNLKSTWMCRGPSLL